MAGPGAHFPFLTNRAEPLPLVEAEHRQHAVVELTIRDLKDQALARFPSGQFQRQQRLDRDRRDRSQPNPLDHRDPGLPQATPSAPPAPYAAACSRSPDASPVTARQWTLHLPARWPWQDDFTNALTRIRALPAALTQPPLCRPAARPRPRRHRRPPHHCPATRRPRPRKRSSDHHTPTINRRPPLSDPTPARPATTPPTPTPSVDPGLALIHRLVWRRPECGLWSGVGPVEVSSASR